MRSRRPLGRSAAALALLLVVLLSGFLAVVTVSSVPARAAAVSSPPVTGSVTGPALISVNSTTQFKVAGWGGPGVAANGSLIGNVRYFASPVGTNLTGVSISPPTANFTSNRSIAVNLVVGTAAETLTLDVMISSTYQGKNESANFTYVVNVVTPYVISATIVNPTSATVSGFPVYVTLDGAVVGEVNVSSLLAGAKYELTFRYPTLGLASGDHTFAISLAEEHGLVTFANGQLVYSETVYVTGPPPNYTLWYVAGIVAFFGAIFIFLTRVAARRRGAARR